MSSRMPSATARASRGGTTTPQDSGTCSGMPPTAVATTGRAQNSASRVEYGKASEMLVSTTTSASAKAVGGVRRPAHEDHVRLELQLAPERQAGLLVGACDAGRRAVELERHLGPLGDHQRGGAQERLDVLDRVDATRPGDDRRLAQLALDDREAAGVEAVVDRAQPLGADAVALFPAAVVLAAGRDAIGASCNAVRSCAARSRGARACRSGRPRRAARRGRPRAGRCRARTGPRPRRARAGRPRRRACRSRPWRSARRRPRAAGSPAG